MGSIEEIMQVCRLCLVKEQVNIPIFAEETESEQRVRKINSCLPVKVNQNDNLPKKICDGCSYKLDMMFLFRNTSVNSEKQLIQWLSDAGVSASSLPQSSVKDNLAKSEISVKQETFDNSEVNDLGTDAHTYIMQQQKLPYQQNFAFAEASSSASTAKDEAPTPRKRPRRAAAAATVSKKKDIETDEEDEDDDLDAAMQITKAEDDDSDEDRTDFVEAPSTSADDQPGPSGVGAGTTEAPLVTNHQHGLKRVQCKLCNKFLSSSNYLRAHVKYIHSDMKPPFVCKECGKEFKIKKNFIRHQASHLRKPVQFNCNYCKEVFLKKGDLDKHFISAHKNVRFECKDCGKTFASMFALKDHEKRHATNYVKPEFKCTVCSVVLNSRGGFRRHLQMHQNSKFHICHICGKKLTTTNSYNSHLLVHSGEKPFACDICGKTFNKKNMVAVHKRVHTKEKPYKCEFCDKSFSQHSPWVIHCRLHTGEKPYSCSICKKNFVSRSALNIHKRCHGVALTTVLK